MRKKSLKNDMSFVLDAYTEDESVFMEEFHKQMAMHQERLEEALRNFQDACEIEEQEKLSWQHMAVPQPPMERKTRKVNKKGKLPIRSWDSIADAMEHYQYVGQAGYVRPLAECETLHEHLFDKVGVKHRNHGHKLPNGFYLVLSDREIERLLNEAKENHKYDGTFFITNPAVDGQYSLATPWGIVLCYATWTEKGQKKLKQKMTGVKV